MDHLLQRGNTYSSPPVDDDLVIPSDASDIADNTLGNDADDTSHTPPAISRDTDNSMERRYPKRLNRKVPHRYT